MTVPDPLGRKETYYSAILGRDVETPEPLGREEMYLEAISEHTHDMEDDIDTLQHQVAAMASDMKYKGSVADYEHLPTNANRGDVYTTLDTGKEYVYDGTTWVEISGGSGSQVETMPTASAETVGEIVQYVGETTTDYTNGYFYKGTGSEATNERVAYAWTQLNVQPAGGSSTVIWGDIEGNLSSQADLQSALNAKQTTANLVTSVSASSTDTQYPSAKLLYDTVGNVETLLTTLISGGGAQ